MGCAASSSSLSLNDELGGGRTRALDGMSEPALHLLNLRPSHTRGSLQLEARYECVLEKKKEGSNLGRRSGQGPLAHSSMHSSAFECVTCDFLPDAVS